MPFFNLNELSEKERKKYIDDLNETAINNMNQQHKEEQDYIKSQNVQWTDTGVNNNNGTSFLDSLNDFFSYNNSKNEYGQGANNSIFQKRAFNDGYQFGDISATIVGTGINAFDNAVKGVSRLGEGISDFAVNRIADVTELAGNKERANIMRTNALKDDTDTNIVSKNIQNLTDGTTVLGEKGQNFVQQLSNTAFQATIGAGGGMIGGKVGATLLANGSMFLSSAGNSETEALNEQYSKAVQEGYNEGITNYLNSEEGKKAKTYSKIYGNLAGAIEVGTEAMFGGLGKITNAVGFGTSGTGLDDKLAKGLASKVSSTLAKNLIEFGVKAGSESIEELVGGIGDAIAQKLTYKQGEGLKDLIKDQNIPEAMLSAFVSSAIMQAPGMYSTTKNGQDFMSGLNQQDSQTYENLLENEQKQLIKSKAISDEYNKQIKGEDFTEAQKAQILEKITQDYDNGYLTSTKLSNDEIEQTENTAMSMLEEIKRIELNQSNLQQVNNQQSIEETNQVAPAQQNIEISNDDNLITSAEKYGYDSKDISIQNIQKMFDRRNIKGRFDSSKFTNEKQGALYTYTQNEDGSYTREIILNPNANSKTIIQEMAMHEITHDIIASKTTLSQNLFNDIVNHLKENNSKIYNDAREDLDNAYREAYKDKGQEYFESKEYQDILDEETVAKSLQKMIGTQERVNKLVQDNRNLAQKFYDYIKDKIDTFKHRNDSEYLFWKDVGNRFEKAFNETEFNPTENREFRFEINPNFSKEYDNWNKKDRSGNFVLGNTSKALQEIGLNDNNIVIDKSKVLKILNEHPEMTDDIIKKIPQILENPTLILKSQTVDGRITLFNEINAEDGKPVLVAMELNPDENKNNIEQIYKVASAYGRQNVNTIQKWLNVKENILYIDNKKNRTENWLTGLGLQLPVPDNLSSSTKIVPSNNKNVNNKKFNIIDNINQKNPDIRYSVSTDGKMQDNDGNKVTLEAESGADNRNLLAIHNLTEDKLKGVLELGGFPVPSIAITDPNKVEHNQFGDISVIFKKETINPSNKANEVYDRDVWSPTFPQVDYDINNENIKKYISKDFNYDYKDSILSDAIINYLYAENLNDKVNRWGLEDTLKNIKDSNAMKYLYKKTVAKEEYTPITKAKKYSNYHTNESLQRFIENFNEDMSLDDYFYHYFNYGDMKLSTQQKEELKQNIIESIKPEVQQEVDSDFKDNVSNEQKEKYFNAYLNMHKENFNNQLRVYEYLQDAIALKNSKNSETIDEKATLDDISNKVNQTEYEKWVDNTFGEMFKNTQKGIRNDKETFTRSGNRRSFNQLHDEYNLSNIVNALTKGDTKASEGGVFGGGFGQIQANRGKRFESIQDIKNAENRIVKGIEASKQLEPLVNSIKDDIQELSQYYNETGFINHGFDNSASAISEFAGKTNLTPSNLKKVLNSYYNFKTDEIPSELYSKIINDIKSLDNIPTDYFEAKPQRAVGLDEIEAIVIPNNISEKLKQQLKEKGIKTIEYNPENETEKADILKALDQYKFSKESKNFDEFLKQTYGKYADKGTRTSLGELKLPIKEKQYSKPDNLPIQEKQLDTKQQDIIKQARLAEKLSPNAQGIVSEFEGMFKDGQYSDEEYSQMKQMIDSMMQDTPLAETTYKESKLRQDNYRKYKNDRSSYDESAVDFALSTIMANRNDNRTVKQWNKVANTIGEQLAINNKTVNEVEKIAYRSWYDLQPTKNITKYDNQAKQTVGFERLTLDDWLNSVYKSYKDNVQVEEQKQILPTTQKVENTQQEVNLPTAGEQIDYSQMERPTDDKKGRKFYKSVIESSNTTAEAKAIAKELMQQDTYVPDSNKAQLQRADKNIQATGVDTSLETLKGKISNGDRITATDIATSERLIEYYSKIGDKEKLQDAIQTSAMAGTEAGRTVQALSILNHSTPEGQVTWIQRSVDKMNDSLEKSHRKERFEFTPEMQQEILQADNMEEAVNNVYKQLGEQVPMSFLQKVDAWRYFSMLGNPRTHIRNIVGNKMMGFIQGAKNKLAGAIEDIVLSDSDDRQFTMARADKKTREFAKADTENVLDRLGLTENKYNPKSRIEQNQKVFKSDILNNTIGKLMNFNDSALEAEDGWGLKAMYPKALAQYLTANDIDVDHITDSQLAKARNFAIRQAEEATFHQDNAIASAISQFEGKNKLTRLATGAVLPFKKTPMNVAVEGIQYSPVGLVDSLTRGSIQLRKGDINVHQYIDGISKGLTGTGIALLGYALTEAGILKASGGDDEDKNDFEDAQGKQNYSIKIGDKTYSLDWLAPTGIPLFIGSELHQIANQKVLAKGEKSETSAVAKEATKILNSMATAMNPLSEMSMISGLTNTLQSYASGNKGLENLGLNATKSYIGQFVPTALGQVAKTFDNKERSTTSTESDPFTKTVDSLKNQVKSKIPGLRQTLPTKTDIWGNDMNNTGNVLTKGLETGVLPWTRKDITTNDTDKALTELYDKTQDSSVLPDSSISKTLSIDKDKYRLTNEQYAKYKKQYGQTSYNVLSGLTKSSEYNKMTDEQKVKAVSEVYKYAKAQIKSQYAKENEIDTEDSSILQNVQSIAYNGGKAEDYFKYIGMTAGAENSKEKASILENSKLSSKAKKAIYSSTLGKSDNTYADIKDAIDINNYLNYKSQDLANKEELDSYLANSNMTYEEQNLLYGTKYKLSDADREDLFTYIDNLGISEQSKLNIYSKLKGFKVVGDTIYY